MSQESVYVRLRTFIERNISPPLTIKGLTNLTAQRSLLLAFAIPLSDTEPNAFHYHLCGICGAFLGPKISLLI